MKQHKMNKNKLETSLISSLAFKYLDWKFET